MSTSSAFRPPVETSSATDVAAPDSALSRASESAQAPVPAPGPARGIEPPRKEVLARKPLDPKDFAARSYVEPGCTEVLIAHDLFSTLRDEARAYAERLRKLAALWDDSDEDPDGGELYVILIADARRITLHQARALLHDACTAVTALPMTLARLEAGDLPVTWFELLLRRVRRLTPDQCIQVDDRVSRWDLANIPCDRFTRELGKLVAWFGAAAVHATPAEQRDVALQLNPDHDGTARVVITGPIHEILGFTRRLDLAAREVQSQQRRALEENRPAPFDIDGDVVRDGRQMTLAALRYAIVSRTMLDTGGIEVPQSRLRLQVVVPALTLLGETDAPGTIDGTIPLPARLARHLAADESTWYRILTDPTSGAFLPLPPSRYSPTATMREHLRLLDPVCAVPGCTRNVCTVGEADHIEEYNHRYPEQGGQTSIENLHRLCWTHHDMKTRGLLDPVREPDGTTTWYIGGQARLTTHPNRDLLTPELADALQRSWEFYDEMMMWDSARTRGLLQDADPAPPVEAAAPVDAAPPFDPESYPDPTY